MRGTPAAYEALLNSSVKPSQDTLYFISEANANSATLYLGEKLIAGGTSEIELSFSNITDIALSEDLADKDILAYDSASHKWVNVALEDIISAFVGATEDSFGVAGLVPAPEAGQTNLFLRSDGTWAAINTQDSINIKTIVNEDASAMHLDLIAAETADLLLNAGDVIIVKDKIAADKWQHTSYIYNGEVWCAMDGNYNAENVYFDEDFTFTENIGTITIPSSGSTQVTATGMNIKEFLASLFAKEVFPVTTDPTAAVSCTNAGAYEVGTKIIPQFKVSFNPGSYTYGPDTGVSVLAYHVNDSEGSFRDTQSGSMDEITVVDNMNYKIDATVDYSDGAIPKTNIGNNYEDGQILEGYAISAASANITGYRNLFVGADASGNAINSNFIRTNLTAKGDASKKYTITWKAADLPGIKRYIVAIPSTSSRKVTKAIITSSMNADCTADYILQPNSVSVYGANNYNSVNYKLWIYEPSVITADQVHEITIS